MPLNYLSQSLQLQKMTITAIVHGNITTGSCKALQGRYYLPNTVFSKFMHDVAHDSSETTTAHFQTILGLMWMDVLNTRVVVMQNSGIHFYYKTYFVLDISSPKHRW